MENILFDCIKNNVSLIVFPLDGITGKSIRGGNLKVWIENEAPAIKKQEGYFIFINLKQRDFILKIEGEIYRRQEIKIDRKKLEECSGEIMRVRLIPNHNYPMPPNIIPIEGIGEDGTFLYTHSEMIKNPYRLIQPYESGNNEISFFHPGDVNMEGSALLIKNRETNEREIFKTGSRIEEKGQWTYLVNEPLKGSYGRVETVLYRVFFIHK